jgi:hypothetical protein
LPRRRHRDQQRAEDVCFPFVEAAGDRAVDPRREVIDCSVPPDRDRPGPREDLVVLVQVKLEVRALFGQA